MRNNTYKNPESQSGFILVFAVAVAGIASIVTQIIYLREFLSVFCGNELIIGIVMAIWMVLTATGTFIGRYAERIRDKLSLLGFLIALLGIIPPITVFFIRYFRNIFFDTGSMPGLLQIIFTSLLFLAPFCFISGFSFTVASVLMSEQRNENRIPYAYSWEAVGSVTGGLAFSIGYLYSIQTFGRLFLLLLLTLSVVYFISLRGQNNFVKILFLLVAVILFILGRSINIEKMTIGFIHKGQKVLFYNDTPYGSLTVTEQGNQYNFYENNVLQFSTNDPASAEESVHYAMLQHREPRDVLLVSGGISGTIEEILKYNVERIDYVELNPAIFQVGSQFTNSLRDSRINMIPQDGRLFIHSTISKYDVVIISLPDPVTAQINRYYTTEFYSEVKNILKPDGVIGLSLSSSADYMSEEAKVLRSVLYSTLKAHFLNILIVPGLRDYFIASDLPLTIRFSQKYASRGLNNLYVNEYYIDDDLLARRSQGIQKLLSYDLSLNTDFRPVSYYQQLLLWLKSFNINYWLLIIVCLALVVYSLIRTNVISYGMYTAGFAGSGIEIVLLLAFQILYGYVYQMMGVLIAVFMGGLAVGAFLRRRLISNATIMIYIFIQVFLAMVIILIPVILYVLQTLIVGTWLMIAAFAVPTFVVACLVGAEFSLATDLQRGSYSAVASILYGFDLIGSAVGALLVTAFLVPWLGVTSVCVVLAVVVLSSAFISFSKRKKFTVT